MESAPANPLFSERNSIRVEDNVEALFSPPEIELSAEEESEARQFAKGLFSGRIYDLEIGTDKSLEQINKLPAKDFILTFYPAYFLQEQAQPDLDNVGLTGASPDAIQAFLLDTDIVKGDEDLNLRRTLAVKSSNWYKEQLEKALEKDATEDEQFQDFKKLKVNYRPSVLVNKVEGIQAYRRLYREVARTYQEDPQTNLGLAKEALLQVHRAKVNNMMANVYIDAVDLINQLRTSNSPEDKIYLAKLEDSLPIITRALVRDRSREIKDLSEEVPSLNLYMSNFARRLDYLRQGVGKIEGRISPITPELTKLFEDPNQPESTPVAPILNEETVERLQNMDGNSEILVSVLKETLRRWDLLSEHSADENQVKSRTGYAPDSKWQIVTKKKKGAAETDGLKRVIWVSEEVNKSLIDCLGTAVHEATHVLQRQFADELAKQIPLATTMGRRNLTLREGGAIDQEAKLKAMFGVQRPTNPHYLKALQAKLSGANKIQAARIFFGSHIENKLRSQNELTDKEAKKSRVTAVSSTLRLWRHGDFDSQALDYAEQALIMKALRGISEDKAEAVSVAGSSFSLEDSAKLHRFGLYNLPTSLNHHPAKDVAALFIEKYLPNLIATSALQP